MLVKWQVLMYLKHFINKKLISFLFSIVNSKSPCLANFKDYFRNDSYILKYTQGIFLSMYGVENILSNDISVKIKDRLRTKK